MKRLLSILLISSIALLTVCQALATEKTPETTMPGTSEPVLTVTLVDPQVTVPNSDDEPDIDIEVSGEFAASVIDVIPNHPVHPTEPAIPMLMLFQDSPFLLDINWNSAVLEKLSKGKHYIFTVKAELLDEERKALYLGHENVIDRLEIPELMRLFNLTISSVREVETFGMGTAADMISFNTFNYDDDLPTIYYNGQSFASEEIIGVYENIELVTKLHDLGAELVGIIETESDHEAPFSKLEASKVLLDLPVFFNKEDNVLYTLDKEGEIRRYEAFKVTIEP